MNEFFFKKYHPADYNCLHFSIDVWKQLTGQDIKELFSSSCFSDIRRAGHKMIRNFKKVDSNCDLCLVAMQSHGSAPHIGVKIENDIFHFGPNGTQKLDCGVVTFGYSKIRYYIPC